MGYYDTSFVRQRREIADPIVEFSRFTLGPYITVSNPWPRHAARGILAELVAPNLRHAEGHVRHAPVVEVIATNLLRPTPPPM